MPYLEVLGKGFEKSLSYLKSAPSNLSIWKNSQKYKHAQPKLPYLGIFGLDF